MNPFQKQFEGLLPLLIILLALGSSFALAASEPGAQIRVNQVGFLIDDDKTAFLMASRLQDGAAFRIIRPDDTLAFSGVLQKTPGSWNQNYKKLYLLDFSGLKEAGRYSIRIDGSPPVVSPSFQIGTGKEIYSPLLQNSLFFFQAQRDGPDVLPAVLNRRPSHLSDRQAFVYKAPVFGGNGIQGGLERIGGPIDVSGGWHDAGDYLKFVETASYVTAVMLQGARDYPAQMGPGGTADFAAEGRHGLDWLLKMWDDQTKTLYIQVGIGDGNDKITGDHDRWRLPEADDQLDVSSDSPDYFLKYRPVFEAGPAGASISPNLAGRMAAAFAIGYQVFHATDPAYADRLLLAAENIFQLAATTNNQSLTTVFPHEFYPEDQWRDDMEWGATEIYWALSAGKAPRTLPHADAAYYMTSAAQWARAYLNSDDQDSLNLYDVSGLAHYDLCRAIDQTSAILPTAVTRADLVTNLKDRLAGAEKRAGNEAFGLGVSYGQGDLVPHVLGLVLECRFYDELTHSETYANFARKQLDFVLGANAWGTSFIVGAGTVFPFHMQHQIANLSGSLDGSLPLLLGATVDGPAHGKPKMGDVPEGARPTPWPNGKDPFAPFSGNGVYYLDDVSCWQTVEPADDYTVLTALIFAQLAGR